MDLEECDDHQLSPPPGTPTVITATTLGSIGAAGVDLAARLTFLRPIGSATVRSLDRGGRGLAAVPDGDERSLRRWLS